MPPLEDTEQTSLADDLRAAMQELDSPPEQEQGAQGASSEQEEPASTAPASAQPRDVSGKFAPKTPAEASQQVPASGEQAAQEGQPAPQEQRPAVAQQEQIVGRAPVSWTPAAREEWAKLPSTVQQEVMRREREITQTLTQTSEARNFYAEFSKTVQPFLRDIESENSTPLKAVEHMFNTAGWLRRGSPQQKAGIVANIIGQYGIDVNVLDEILASGAARNPALFSGQQTDMSEDRLVQAVEQRLAPVLKFVSTLQERIQTTEKQQEEEMVQSSREFLDDPKNEFAWDVKDDMADILELAARRGQKMSLQDAYSRAIMLHPTISKIVESRKTTQEPLSPAAIRAKQAASASLPSSGAPMGGDEDEDGAGNDLRKDIMGAVRSLSKSSR